MSTPTFPFPQSLAEKYRPHSISDFAGLEKPKRILSKFAANPYSVRVDFYRSARNRQNYDGSRSSGNTTG